MSKATIISVVAALGVTLAPTAFAQSSTNEFGQTTYPASLAGVEMASVPAGDLCQLDGNEGLTADALVLVDNEILARGLICDPLLGAPTGLEATNLAGVGVFGATVLVAALSAGGGGGSTPDTQ